MRFPQLNQMHRFVIPLACLWMAGLASAAPAQKKLTFLEVRKRIEREANQPAAKRLTGIRLIGKFHTPQARRLLLDLWKNETDNRVRTTVLGLVVKYENPQVAKVLTTELMNGKSSARKRTAAYGLLRQERPGMQALARALRSPSSGTREAAIGALTTAARKNDAAANAIAKVLPELTGRQQLRGLLALRTRKKTAGQLKIIAQLLSSKDVTIASEALRQVALAGDKSIKPELLRKANDESAMKNATLRSAVFFALCVLADPETLPAALAIGMEGASFVKKELAAIDKLPKARDNFVRALAKSLEQNEVAVERLVAVELLTRFRTKAADRALVRALQDRSTAVVLAAMIPVKKREIRSAIPTLRKLFGSNHPELRMEAMLAIHSVMRRDPRWPKQLMEQLDSPKVGLRCAAVDLLAELEYRGALPRIHGLLAAQEWQVRSAAYGFLKKVRDKSSIDLLIQALGKERGRLQSECMSALISLTHRNYHKVDYWKRWWAAVAHEFKLPKPVKVAKGRGKKGGKSKGSKGDKAAPKELPAGVTYYSIPVFSKRTCFLVDTSGSMQQPSGTSRDAKLKHAKEALIQVLKGCAPDHQFNVVPFSGSCRSWATTLQEMTKPNRLEAITFARKLKARGGTNIYDALRTAFDDMSVDTIYLLSDGSPSSGKVTDIEELGDLIQRWNRDRRIIIHTIAFGRHSKLLKRLAADSGGKYVRFI